MMTGLPRVRLPVVPSCCRGQGLNIATHIGAFLTPSEKEGVNVFFCGLLVVTYPLFN